MEVNPCAVLMYVHCCLGMIGSFTALEPLARRVEEALADVCDHDSAAISCLQALPFSSLQPTGKPRQSIIYSPAYSSSSDKCHQDVLQLILRPCADAD